MSLIKRLPTIILPVNRWPEIEPIERDVFHDSMPTSIRQSGFLAALTGENDDIAGHLRIEQLYHLVHVHARPELRNYASVARQLMTEAAETIPEGFSGVWLTRKPYPHLAKALGARLVGEFFVYRRDN